MDFSVITLFLVAASLAGIVAKFLKQPLLIGYLVAGLFLSVSGIITDFTYLDSLAKIGVTLLLFLLGLEMNIRDLPSIGKVAIVTGLGQIIFTSLIGYFLAILLGFSTMPAVYIAVALTFSSTIIMVKLLSEKKDLGSLYGKIAIGFLLVQDFVAVIILMFLGGLGSGGVGAGNYFLVAGKAILLLLSVWFSSKKILPLIFEKLISSSTELLSIASIAWALGVASLVAGPLGFSLEIGGFLAGIALSNIPEHFQIESRTKPIRDFFLVIFFLLLGTQLVVGPEFWQILPKAIILSAFVLIGNPIIVLILMGLLGYKRRTSFMAGLTVAQISEFSFILVNMGKSLGHLNETHVATVVVVGVVTMTISTYMILGAEKIFNVIHKHLSIFEKKKTNEGSFVIDADVKDHIVVVGADRTGSALIKYLQKKEYDIVVVDYNPSVFSKLHTEGVSTVFGDVNDPDVAAAARINDAKMIISTINSLNANRVLLQKIDKKGKILLITASSVSEARELYEKGATYVVVPEVVAGEHIRHMLANYKTSRIKFRRLGKNHLENLIYIFDSKRNSRL